MQPRETWTSNGLVVRATGSTDEGVGFLVTVDGLTLYHAGDHARWVETLDHAFMAEIQWLKDTRQPIDVAFFAIATGGRCEPRPAIWEGVRSAARVLAPRVLIPMHVGCLDRLDLYQRFRRTVGGQIGATQVVAPTRIGESFRYRSGKIGPGNQ
jgi:L-ascorbate metabolism protein UlaG (beta-lactamase superfamily)